MSRPCISGCGRSVPSSDGHDRCIACLGLQHAKAAFMDESCSHCGNMTIAELRSRLRDLSRGRVPSATPQSVPSTRGDTLAGGQGDLRVTVWNTAPTMLPRATPPSVPQQPASSSAAAGPSSKSDAPRAPLGAPEDDAMSIAASQGELGSSGDEDSVGLPPSGVPAFSETDPELTAMLARAATSIGLVWKPPPCPERSRLDDWFLGAARADSRLPGGA